jgi:3-hydroxyacyl-CoA dehydrogenase/enoyl-CoA hydratase/3-hydroxybutyryl-CoA epimerase
MPLLEVIPTDDTAPEAIVTAVRFGRRMGKTVIVAADHPGFWVNRILSPYLNEAAILVAEGVPIDVIDRTMTAWGFPVGPVALLDEVGLDVAQKAGGVMHAAFGDRLHPPDTLARLLAEGRLGRKNGRGFYRYQDGHKAGVDETVYPLLGVRPVEDADTTVIERRLVHAMLNESAMALDEGAVRSSRDGDIGALFGIGYPAFRGGPLRTIDDLTATRVLESLRDLADVHGPRFTPAVSLIEAATHGTRYYTA